MPIKKVKREGGDNDMSFEIFSRILLLLKDASPNIRSVVAMNLNTSADVLEALSKDEDWRVRRAVAGNPNTYADALEVLSKDADLNVRSAVIRNLCSRHNQLSSEILQKVNVKTFTEVNAEKVTPRKCRGVSM